MVPLTVSLDILRVYAVVSPAMEPELVSLAKNIGFMVSGNAYELVNRYKLLHMFAEPQLCHPLLSRHFYHYSLLLVSRRQVDHVLFRDHKLRPQVREYPVILYIHR